MSIRFFLAIGMVLFSFSTTYAQVILVDDDFESYQNDAELYAVWEPRNGSGTAAPTNPDDGILESSEEFLPGVEGQGVDHIGGSVMQHLDLAPGSEIFPSNEQTIRMAGDIWIGLDGNSRMSIGMRNRSATGNLIELGTYNSNGDSINPYGEPDVPPATVYAYRLTLFDIGEGIVSHPNWYFFQFDPSLDTKGDLDEEENPIPDGVVDPQDFGAGWHRYSAIITPETITLELDIYRDGLDNAATLAAGSDVSGVDSSVTYPLITRSQGYDSFRIGAPSGISSANKVGFDNLFLGLYDAADADFDGDVDGNDFFRLQKTNPEGLARWQTLYGTTVSGSAIAAVPEPGSTVLGALAVLLLSLKRNRH